MLYALVGSSGSGKTTIGEKFFGKENELISFTTRPIRENEVDGVDYLFLSKEEFYALEEQNMLVEKTEYDSNFYGLTKEEVESKLKIGSCYAVVDMHGAFQLKEQYPNDTVIVFIYVDKEKLTERLTNGDRNETESFIANRLSLYDKELESMKCADYVINNNTSMEQAIEQLKEVYEKENKQEKL